MENEEQIHRHNWFKKLALSLRNRVEESSIPFIYLIILKKIFRLVKSPKIERGEHLFGIFIMLLWLVSNTESYFAPFCDMLMLIYEWRDTWNNYIIAFILIVSRIRIHKITSLYSMARDWTYRTDQQMSQVLIIWTLLQSLIFWLAQWKGCGRYYGLILIYMVFQLMMCFKWSPLNGLVVFSF